jgi:hypothetical protein
MIANDGAALLQFPSGYIRIKNAAAKSGSLSEKVNHHYFLSHTDGHGRYHYPYKCRL